MTVTGVEAVTGSKTKYRVYIDGQPAFVLYKGELSRYCIGPEKQLDDKTKQEIEALLIKRAKLRAMHLLNAMDRTEEQLRQKLLEGGYGRQAAEEALAYVKSYGYINDNAYVRRFIESKKSGKSRKEIYALLMKKGLPKEQIEEALEEVYGGEDALAAIRKLADKKHFVAERATEEEKRRMYAYLMRKGFRYEDVRQVIQVSELNT